MSERRAWPRIDRPEKACGIRDLLQRLACYLLTSATLVIFSTSDSIADVGVPPVPIYNFYGQVGLLDMPNGRVAPDGEIAFTFASDKTDDHYNLDFEALPWLETTFRYARIDRLALPESPGDLYDRSLSVKVRLSQEDNVWPSMTIGAQDILGTGIYGGEYLAASKRFGNFDFSAGIGWRRLAGLASFPNPFGLIFPSFKSYGSYIRTGGVPDTGEYFHGPKAGFFGGVTWQTPIDGLTLIAELSGDSYTQEQQAGSIDVRSHINLGLSYEPVTGLEIGGGYLYGSEWGMRITVHMNAFDPPPGPKLGPAPLDPVIRTTEQRADATQNLLESITHFYDEGPRANPILPRAAIAENFADHIFDSAEQSRLSIKDTEIFGDDMILEVAGKPARFKCADLSNSAENAAPGLKQLVVIFTGSSQTDFCTIGPKRQNLLAHQYASLDNFSMAEGNSPDAGGEVQTKGETSQNKTFDAATTKQKLIKDASAQKLAIIAAKIEPTRIEIALYNSTYRSDDEAMGRLLRVLMADAPPSVEEFKIINMSGFTPTVAVTFSRADIERVLEMFGSGSELQSVSKMSAVSENDPLLVNYSNESFPSFYYSVAPGLNKSFFDPDNPVRIGVFLGLNGGVNVDRHLNIDGTFDVNLYNTFNITRPPNSLLPHVRTDFAEYYKKGINGISNLQATYFTKLAPEFYAVARVGYLEDMFGGAGGEVLWEPVNTRWALGASLYEVQQRNFDRLFGFQSYRILTGHASLYYQSPFYGLDFQLHVGRYLAGDYGATFQVTRRFDNGIEIGAYATLTNVPFSVFGEGSFDKGFIVHIPLDNVLPVHTKNDFEFDFSPLTRDGGQMLENEQMLYRYLQDGGEGELRANWDEVLRP